MRPPLSKHTYTEAYAVKCMEGFGFFYALHARVQSPVQLSTLYSGVR